MNQVVLIGEYGVVFHGIGYEGWWLEIKVDGETFDVKVWKGIVDALLDKPTGTKIAIKGKLFYDEGRRIKVQAERVSIMSIEQPNLA